jgi:hypothetical protein
VKVVDEGNHVAQDKVRVRVVHSYLQWKLQWRGGGVGAEQRRNSWLNVSTRFFIFWPPSSSGSTARRSRSPHEDKLVAGVGAVARCCAVSVGPKSSGHLALGITSGRHVIKERPALMDCVGAILQKPSL